MLANEKGSLSADKRTYESGGAATRETDLATYFLTKY